MRQFYGRLEKCVVSAGKPVSIKFLVLGGGGWQCRFYFYGRGDFSDKTRLLKHDFPVHNVQTPDGLSDKKEKLLFFSGPTTQDSQRCHRTFTRCHIFRGLGVRIGQYHHSSRKKGVKNGNFHANFTLWAAANGGVTNGGLRGEIGRNRPFSPFFCLFRPFPEGPNSP